MNSEELVKRSRALQEQYWTPNAAEKQSLIAEGVERLEWEKSLRLLHLACLDLVSTGPGREELVSDDSEGVDAPEGPDRHLIVQLLQRLRAADSPYKERHVSVWQGNPGESDTREPNAEGKFRNASLTHLGSIEVIRLDAQDHPVSMSFVPLDDLRGAAFAPPAVFRFGRLFFDNQRADEFVLVPLLYGISWRTPNLFDRDGTMTRFISHVEVPGGQGAFSIGVGHQDFVVESRDGSQTLLGLGSVGEIMVGLTLDDPKFDAKCRARGLDPAEVRSSVG